MPQDSYLNAQKPAVCRRLPVFGTAFGNGSQQRMLHGCTSAVVADATTFDWGLSQKFSRPLN
jgi:hypothetical protein